METKNVWEIPWRFAKTFQSFTSKSDKNGETITISPRKILTKEITELFKVFFFIFRIEL